MSELPNESEDRIFRLEETTVNGLASRNINDRRAALNSLPNALNRQEISSVAMLVGFHEEPQRRNTDKIEGRIVFDIGVHALRSRFDLVTADSAAQELRKRHQVVGYVALSWLIRRTKHHIIETIINKNDHDLN